MIKKKCFKAWPPLWSMLKSLPFWALLMLLYGHSWGIFFLLTAAPRFLNEVRIGENSKNLNLKIWFPYI